MGPKKQNSGACEGPQGAGRSSKGTTSNQKKVVGADYVKSNGAVIGAKLAEKSRNFWKGMMKRKFSEKGMGLSFVAPSDVNGENIEKLDKHDVDRLTETWMNSIIV